MDRKKVITVYENKILVLISFGQLKNEKAKVPPAVFEREPLAHHAHSCGSVERNGGIFS